MKAKDKTEDVLKSIHVLFSKAEYIEGSKRKVIIDKERMMHLLKDLNDCMYAMMDEYEITSQSKEKALRETQKRSDNIVFEARKQAEDIYAAAIMFTDRSLEEIQSSLEKTRIEVLEAQERFNEIIENHKKEVKDNQIDLKNTLSGLIDTQKYLMLIENENTRLKHEAEKMAENAEKDSEESKKVVPDIRINEDYMKAAGYISSEEDEEESDEELPELAPEEIAKLDEEYFKWKNDDNEDEEDNKEPKRGFFGFGRKA